MLKLVVLTLGAFSQEEQQQYADIITGKNGETC
jgi:hypothetical protein